MMKSLIRLRVLNAVGAVIFVVCGLLIRAYPVALLNRMIVLIDLYYRLRRLSPRNDFTLKVPAYSKYLCRIHFSQSEDGPFRQKLNPHFIRDREL